MGYLLLLSVLGYLAGVGIAAAFGRTDPWISGLSGLGPVLGVLAVRAWSRRSGRDRQT
ncbi:hypothetical protein [Amycolatopsis sp.]|uniref:hypothetical protein n=1 Tax=Amycolatopsis sp. TaxID=37632 RepID=UPI002D8013B9|nr:hypothetical protein [Amycolatopsis sp.]HET6703825.1 hypothetical protein [Amycolatopsis sp.]